MITSINRPLVESSLLVLALQVSSLVAPAPAAESLFQHFVTVRGDQLFDGEVPLRFVSFNIPNLHMVEDEMAFLGSSAWRWPNTYEIEDALESVRQMGGVVARTYVLSVKREGSDMRDHVHVLAPGKFNEKAFQALDRVLAVANSKGVRVFIPLVDNWHWMGGVRQYEAFRNKPEGAFWTDPIVTADFKRTITYLLNRRNTVTGQLYREDKAIFCWETGNELDAPAEWTAQIARHIKQLDPNHLVMDGRSLHGVPEWSLNDPNVDILTTHHYPGPQRDIPAEVRHAIAKTKGRKPYVVGEVGFVPTEELSRIFESVEHSHAAGALVWSLRFHRRDGGFYWHSEPAVGGVYKAYHWPGFASGEGYDERRLLQLMREAAHRIRSVDVSPIAAPRTPSLLPAESPHELSWRGVAGAASYELQRATTPGGPWRTIAREVSDAQFPYRPLFSDLHPPTKLDLYYRVLAHNDAGASPPSASLGPLRAEYNWVIDELTNFDQTSSVAGDVVLMTDNPRATREDQNRALLAPGAMLHYKPPGAIARIRIWAFAPPADPPGGEEAASSETVQYGHPQHGDIPLSISLAQSNGDSVTLQSEARTTDEFAGDYGYLRPWQLEVTCQTAVEGTVSIQNVDNSPQSRPWQVGRVEIAYEPGH